MSDAARAVLLGHGGMPEGMVDLVMEKAGTQAGRLDWAAIDRAGRQRLGYPIRITV